MRENDSDDPVDHRPGKRASRMTRPLALVTGSSGLIGSEVVDYFCRPGLGRPRRRQQHARRLLRSAGDTRWNQRRLRDAASGRSVTTSSTSAIATASTRSRARRAPTWSSTPRRSPATTWRPAGRSTTSTSTPSARSTCSRRCAGTAPRRRLRPPVAPTRSTATRRTESRCKELPTRWDYDDPAYADGIAEDFPSTSRSTRSSAPRRWPPTSWCRSTAGTSACRPAACAAAA